MGKTNASIKTSFSLSLLFPSGLCVVEWCGSVLEGATHEEVRRILAATNHQEEIEFVVKECR